MLTSLLIVALAHAGEPVRCAAAVTAPAPTCSLHGSFAVTAGGKSEESATKAAKAALSVALDKSVLAFTLAQPAADRTEFAGCSALAETAHVDCFPDATLKETKFCFVTLADTDCWSGDVLDVEGTGWKVFTLGTETMCAAVDARVVAQNYSNSELRRAKCAASCLSSTVVRCP